MRLQARRREGAQEEEVRQLRQALDTARAKAGLEKPGIVRAGDFMDPIVEDAPKGVWSLAYDTSATIATLRNWYWPGYFFYHVIESAEYGGVYFGDGLPNVDLPFML